MVLTNLITLRKKFEVAKVYQIINYIKPRLILQFLISLVLFTTSIGQQSKNSFWINVGIGQSIPDKRFDLLNLGFNPQDFKDMVVNPNKGAPPDMEYRVSLLYNHRFENRINLGLEGGYSLLINKIKLPVNSIEYFKFPFAIFFYAKESKYHRLQLAPMVSFCISSNENSELGLGFSGVSNISFKKTISVLGRSEILHRYKWDYSSFELFSFLYLNINKLRLELGVRSVHLKYLDNAIANNGLNPDTYNPFKMRFQLSYALWQK